MVSSVARKVMESVDFSSKSLPCPWEGGEANHRPTVCSSVSRCCLLIRPVWKMVS